MLPPLGVGAGAAPGAEGESYGVVLLRNPAVDAVMATLAGIRFSGWIAPPDDGWLVVLAGPRVVAAGSRGIVEVAALLALDGAPTIAVRVDRDRDLGMVAWQDRAELGRYSSDPSLEHGADVLGQPYGAELAIGLAALLDVDTDTAEKLYDALDEELDPDSVFESERLSTVTRMLHLPTWIVGAGALPRDIPTGPRRRDLTRLRAGGTGATAALRDTLVLRWRRRRRPPPLLDDPPRNPMAGLEPWMF